MIKYPVKIYRMFIILLLINPLLVWTQTVPIEGIQSITPGEMKAHVYYLASDEMKGRNTPSPELDTCAAYISREFKSYGLKPVGINGTYFQTLYILRPRLGETNTLTTIYRGVTTHHEIKNDFVPLLQTANKKLTDLNVVFAGYGITAPEYGYDDYADIDTQGKVVLIFINEPQQKDTASVFQGTKNTEHSRIPVKIENAIKHGAAGILLASSPLRRGSRPTNTWPSLMRNPPKNLMLVLREQSGEKKIVSVRIGKELAKAIVEPTGKTLLQLHAEIDSTLIPRSFEIPDLTITVETSLMAERIPTHNVVGYWEGGDPQLKDELVIIGAHYDHVGTRDDEVYNGADDNASGTAGVMEIAEAFTLCPQKPKRSILFITFTGEEKGLYGSSHYTENPLFPLKKTVAMLNMDMISRNDTNEVAIIGTPTSSDLKMINEKANENIGMTLAYDQEKFFRQSDHYAFYRRDIPVLFYNTRETPDLHKPSDDPNKIIPEKMARIGQLLFSTAWLVADQRERPNFIGRH